MKIKNYKNNKYLFFLIFILFLSILIYFLIKNWNNEDFQNNHKNIYTNFIIEQLNNITFNPLFVTEVFRKVHQPAASLAAPSRDWISPSLQSFDIEYPGCGAAGVFRKLQTPAEIMRKLPISAENDIKLYVISLKHPNRLLHIDNERKKIKEPIFIFDGVKGDNLILENLLEQNILSNSFYGKDLPLKEQKQRFREVGCYMSHLLIYNYIDKYDKNKYTIVFEDDFSIMINNFIQKVNESIKIFNDLNVDFDILLLGNKNMNNGKHLSNDIYYINHNKKLWGTHAYLHPSLI